MTSLNHRTNKSFERFLHFMNAVDLKKMLEKNKRNVETMSLLVVVVFSFQ